MSYRKISSTVKVDGGDEKWRVGVTTSIVPRIKLSKTREDVAFKAMDILLARAAQEMCKIAQRVKA
jgi:hypothetical protein